MRFTFQWLRTKAYFDGCHLFSNVQSTLFVDKSCGYATYRLSIVVFYFILNIINQCFY